MSKKIFVTKGALTSIVKRLVKENADPAFITEPPVAAPPIESDPRAIKQVDQGMLPVEDPEWEPTTQEELASAVAQYISKIPDTELGDVWSDVKTSADSAVERGEANADDLALVEITRRLGKHAGSFVKYLLHEAKDDEWDMGMQGWAPDEVDTPWSDYGSNKD